MTHGSLFSGIGGFDLAAQWCGWTNVFQCEINPFCRRILKYYFKNTELHNDITTTDFKKHRGAVDVISGGFPCQPFSIAGERKGTADDRFLWPEMLRAIREILPLWVVAENVGGLLTQQRGMVFERVCAELEDAGYEVQPFIISACAVGAPHRRERIWIIAHANSIHADGQGRCGHGDESQRPFAGNESSLGVCRKGVAANANGKRPPGRHTNISEVSKINGDTEFVELRSIGAAPDAGSKQFQKWPQNNVPSNTAEVDAGSDNWTERPCDAEAAPDATNDESEQAGQPEQNISSWRDFPTQPPVCSRDDGLTAGLDGITFPSWRRRSIEALGNAIVPQVAYQIFKNINKIKL